MTDRDTPQKDATWFTTDEENLEYYEFENEGPGKSFHLVPKYETLLNTLEIKWLI